MAKFVDFFSDREVQDIMEGFVERFPKIFEGFAASKIGFVSTRKKGKHPIKLHQVKYPHNVWLSKVYIVETLDTKWKKLDQKQKNLHVFRIMCSIPNGGFDDLSKAYGKVLQPDIKMFMQEYAACGGIPNWEENPAAKDPMAQTADDVEKATPVVEAIPADDVVERKSVSAADVATSVKPRTATKVVDAKK